MEDDLDDDDLVFEGDTLTWAAVAEACGANESRYSTRRTASTSTAKISTRDTGKAPAHTSSSKSSRARVQLIDEDEEGEYEEEEDEEEEDDIRDDVEMVDDDDDDDDAEHVMLDDDDDDDA